jgi:hypothetical protein
MSNTRIFVSSTCYDLAAVREDIRNCLIGLGHEPLLSEYSSFPVLPDLQTVENCKKNVRENTDIFVLIVGCKRGSLDFETKKPIVNIEYETAKESGLDTFVFVNRTVKDLLPVWETNPTADFSARVDFPEVFSFVKSIHSDHRWVFPFERTVDITDTLRTQLSVFLRELVVRKSVGKLRPLAEFAAESLRIQQIALEKPRFWEFLLTVELLRNRLPILRAKMETAKGGRLFRPTKALRGSEFINWARERLNDWMRLVKMIEPLITERLVASWGPAGKPGDPLKIKSVVDEISAACEHMIEFEATLSSIVVPQPLSEIVKTMTGWGDQVMDELERIPSEIEKPLREPNPEGSHHIKLVFRDPPGLANFSKEMEKLRANPSVLSES